MKAGDGFHAHCELCGGLIEEGEVVMMCEHGDFFHNRCLEERREERRERGHVS